MDSPSEPETDGPTLPAAETEPEEPIAEEGSDEPGVQPDPETPPEDEASENSEAEASDDGSGAPADARSGVGQRSSIRIGAVVAVAIAAAFVVWLLVRNDDESSSAQTQTITAPVTTPTSTTSSGASLPTATSEKELQRLAASGRTVYWAGPVEKGYTLTLVRGTNGSVYVRYLPPGVNVNDVIPPSLVVATYPLKDALAAVKRAAKSPGSVSIALTNGGTAVYSKSRPTNVYFAYPKSDTQIEVYDPSPGRALQLVTSGTITPVTP